MNGLMVFDRKTIRVPIESHPVYAEARDHALRLGGYNNPIKHHNRIECKGIHNGARVFRVQVRVV